MRNGNFITVDGIEIVLASVVLPNIVTYYLMTIQTIVLPFVFRSSTCEKKREFISQLRERAFVPLSLGDLNHRHDSCFDKMNNSEIYLYLQPDPACCRKTVKHGP